MIDIQCVVQAKAQLGAGTCWDARAQCLWWGGGPPGCPEPNPSGGWTFTREPFIAMNLAQAVHRPLPQPGGRVASPYASAADSFSRWGMDFIFSIPRKDSSSASSSPSRIQIHG